MPDATVNFRHEVIDPDPPGAHIDITLIADVDGDGKKDIIIGGKQGEANLWWYKNPDWERYTMAVSPGLEAGGVVLDLNGDGRPDVVAGQQLNGNELYWFENPPEPPAFHFNSSLFHLHARLMFIAFETRQGYLGNRGWMPLSTEWEIIDDALEAITVFAELGVEEYYTRANREVFGKK